MKTIFSLFTALFFITNIAFGQVKWSVDPAHTNVRFEIKHFGISFVDGQFKTLAGSLESKNAESFDAAVVDVTIDVNSIDTRIEARDTHLKSDDFFSAEKFPKITLANAVLKKGTKGKFTLTGDLTIRDVTKKVIFQVVQNNGTITDPYGKTRAGFTATTSINRKDFNINYADKLPSGVDAVGNEVAITVNVELVKN